MMAKENPFYVTAKVFATIAGFLIVAAAMFNASMFNSFSLHQQEMDTHFYLVEKCLENSTLSPMYCNESITSYKAAQSLLDLAGAATTNATVHYYLAFLIAAGSIILIVLGHRYYR